MSRRENCGNDVVRILPNKMKNGWQCFFQMDVYTWIPSILLERNKTPWLPMCPNRSCNRQCVKNGFNKLPRIVYGMHENYILNAPERYICKACSTTRKRQIESGMQSKDATKAEWNSLDRAVMEQVKDRNPGIFYEFPCVLSHINALDNSVLKLVQDLSVRGVGPSAVCDMMISWHEHAWQKKEVQWLSHLSARMDSNVSSVVGGVDSHLRNVTKCPSYYSSECCGATPSSPYLVTMFNKSINGSRRYFDAEVVRRMKNSMMVAIDASYKVGKWMMRHGDQKIYAALHTGLNEYGEVVMQRWSTSDNHGELEAHLRHLQKLGFEPWWVFSDVPEKDRDMLVRVFKNLMVDVDEDHAERVEET